MSSENRFGVKTGNFLTPKTCIVCEKLKGNDLFYCDECLMSNDKTYLEKDYYCDASEKLDGGCLKCKKEKGCNFFLCDACQERIGRGK